ncbi:hypothetical protein MSUIS_01350 [Mycoplasma suis KI3806]|uniref:Transmembrane protein n=1 Tax=Mycoplasma suis (strain KI_3806) TaxID=708248 RepID=F0V306_MYCS3|nr:hypothetical protein [Mycoplasma suis]CBZ40228.1 hypothetical protein MSUIS_01350 [Mycoplasma suis KI3806]
MVGLSKIMFPVLGFFATIAGGGYVANYLGFLPKQNYLDLSHWKESNTFLQTILKK